MSDDVEIDDDETLNDEQKARYVAVTKWRLPAQLAVGPFESPGAAIKWHKKMKAAGVEVGKFNLLTLVDPDDAPGVDWGASTGDESPPP